VQLQAALRKLGYYTGSIDGLMGPATQAAIRTFQIDHDLSVTGKVDDKLQKALEKEAFGEEQR
jgi:peptidoglycan hydrolase-like protein with peptidoglycan-binding domain